MSSSVRVRVLASAAVAVALVVLSSFVSAAEARQRGSVGADTVGLERAHAHNDYEHDRPLYDALDHRFKSVEADIWLVDGELVVAHDAEDVPQAAEQGRTLRSLYLEPLRQRVKQNRGSVYRGDPDYFTLLVDLKSEANSTYLALHEELWRYRQIFTTFRASGVKDGAVTAIVSGNRPRQLMQHQKVRYAAYDGRMSDLGVATDQTFVPLISDNWTNHFQWMGVGPMPPAEREKLRSIVATAHANGQRVRFWATPEVTPDGNVTPEQREAVWRELLAAEVDYINTDDLVALEQFLAQNDPNPTEPHVYWER